MKSIRHLFYLFLLLFIPTALLAQGPFQSMKAVQDPIRACATDQIIRDQRTHEQYVEREKAMNDAILSYSGRQYESYLLPVVFHIISQNPAAITDQQVLNALQDLNDAFSRSGIYASGVGVNTRIQFCLAQKDPEGGNTTGITRTQSYLSEMDQDLENNRLKNLAVWDPSKYINIWLIKDIQSEILPRFACGQWTRLKEGGYATMPPGGDSTDGIVTTAFGTLLAHEMGHYLGLYHTFEGLSCTNNNCATDGDHVCDTPPDVAVNDAPSCSQPQNSCSSDTLSGFTTDVPDMISNFMDYGNDACHNAFTEGQAARMRAAIATQRSGLLQNECQRPCAENILANFTRNNPYPAPGDLISFTNNSTGATNYSWSIDGTAASTSGNFSHSFPSPGKYKVTLKAYNSNPACFASYSDNIIVGCGVMARFYPDKRKIASKVPLYPDSIYFTNRSVGASQFQWLMSNDKGMSEQVISTGTDLNFTFADPGNYTVRLVASNGSCTDTSEKFNFTVDDPSADGTMSFSIVHCLDQSKIQMIITVCNSGYAPIPANTPISFYDGDPRKPGAKLLEPVFKTPDALAGKCCFTNYQHTVNADRIGLDTLFAVFNDNGSAIPVVLPNTSSPESNYENNFQQAKNFQYKVSVSPATATLLPGDTVRLLATGGPENTSSFVWSSAQGLSCTQCANPFLIADSNTIKKVTGTSEYGCIDSAFAVIKVPPADDFTIQLDSIRCARQDSLLIDFNLCNGFIRGIIPKGLKVSFYDRDPATADARVLGTAFTVEENSVASCMNYQFLVPGMPAGTLFGVVNDAGDSLPLQLPRGNSLPETNYVNNLAQAPYSPDSLRLQPSDTTVIKNQSFRISILTNVANPSSAKWAQGENYSLSCYVCASPLITPRANCTVNMELANGEGCDLHGQAIIRTISGGKVSIPNAFTPNGDGRNEVFYVMGGAEIRSIEEFSIFNRWGQKVFGVAHVLANDPGFGWNGTHGGKPAEPGTYVYLVRIDFQDGTQSTYKGTVTLIR